MASPIKPCTKRTENAKRCLSNQEQVLCQKTVWGRLGCHGWASETQGACWRPQGCTAPSSWLCDSSVIPNHNTASCVSDLRKDSCDCIVKLWCTTGGTWSQDRKVVVGWRKRLMQIIMRYFFGVVLHCRLIFDVKCGIWSTRFNNHWSKVKPLLRKHSESKVLVPMHNRRLCYQQINMNHRAHLTVFGWDLSTICIIRQAHDIVLNLVLNGLRKDHCCVPFHSWLIWHQTSCVPSVNACHKVCPVEPMLNCSSRVLTEGSVG